MIKARYTVGIQCMTYNHSRYILDTLNGFTTQKTTFPYVILIVDDASTDGNDKIIQEYVDEKFHLTDKTIAYCQETEYANITFAQHKNNKNCYIVAMYLKFNHYQIGRKADKLKYLSEWVGSSKYIALCEGDDYWIDPLKLQKQVDFMMAHPDCYVCFHAHINLHESGRIEYVHRYSSNQDNCNKEQAIMGGGEYMATNSMLYTSMGLQSYPVWANEAPVGDYSLMLVLLTKGNIGYIDEIMSVYRVGALGSWVKQMSKDMTKLLFHKKRMLRMYILYNKWSNYKYNKCILTLICRNIIDQLKLNLRILINKFN